MNKIKKLLKENHLMVIGKSIAERKRFVVDICELANMRVLRFPSALSSFDRYLMISGTLFPHSEYEYGLRSLDHLWDIHLDWTHNDFDNLIVLEEFDKMENDDNITILEDYVRMSLNHERKRENRVHFRVIFSQQEENNVFEKLVDRLNKYDYGKRTAQQIVDSYIKVINLDHEGSTIA